MLKKMIKKLKYLYSKKDVGFQYISIYMHTLIENKKNNIRQKLTFPIKAMNAIKNIILGFLLKKMKYISEHYSNGINQKKVAICIGFTKWKRGYFQEYIKEYDIFYLHNYIPTFIVISILKQFDTKYDVFVWSYQEKKRLRSFFELNNTVIKRVEDGFIRSIGLGANQTKPLSLIIDNEELYFNVQKQSRLETIIFNNVLNYSKKELDIACKYIEEINLKKITKYNFKNTIPIDTLKMYLNLQKKTVLVIGQVEDDMSIKLGAQTKIDNLDLLKLAYEENRGANIIFKPHPDVLYKKRKNSIGLDEYAKYGLVVMDNITLFDLIELSDHVYTITSLSGFEALMQGKKVTCLGSPFYAHWGLTDDRDKIIERRKKYLLSLEQLFYAAYIEYPTYLLGNLERTIDAIENYEHMESYTFKDEFIFFDINNNLLLDDLKNKKIAIITASEDISKLYAGMKVVSSSTTIFTLTNAEANKIIEKKELNPKDVIWLARAYATPLSEVENKAVDMTHKISEVYKIFINELVDNIFIEEVKEKLIDTLCLSLEDRIYDQCAIIESLNLLSEDYDKILVFIDNYNRVKIFTNLLISYIDTSKLVFTSNKKMNLKDFKSFLNSDDEVNNMIYSAKKTKSILEKNIIQFKKLWFDFLLPTEEKDKNQLNKDNKKAIIIGNLVDRNYAYYPSVQELVYIIDRFGYSLEFVAAHRLNNNSFNNYRWLLLEISSKISLVDTFSLLISDKKVLNEIKLIVAFLLKSILLSIENKFSKEIKFFLYENIKRAVNELAYQLLFFSKALEITQSIDVVFTTMERSVYSRFIVIAAQFNNKKTIGIQPQVISTSIRYKKPEVDYMCVIDEMQKDNFSILGFDKKKMFSVGSANLRKHLLQIKEEEVVTLVNDESIVSMLFIMQHSMSNTMINIITQLIDVCKTNNYMLFIKPHPHQEKSTILKVADLSNQYNNIVLLANDDNTYKYIKNCNIIIGLFSSAVFEAMLFGKDVLILKDEEIDKSIDFSKLNISLTSNIKDDIKSVLMHYIENTQLAERIRRKRDEFIQNSPYYYSNTEFIKILENGVLNE